MQNQPPMQGQPNIPGNNIPTVAMNRRGWYPRWWLLSALTCSCAIIIISLLWNPVICQFQPGQALPWICGFPSWFDLIQVGVIWIFFAILWFPFMMFGINLVEVPNRQETVLGRVLRQLSQFGSVRPMLLIQGIIAFVMICVLWWLDRSPPVAFAILGIIVFVAHCSEFQHIEAEERSGYIIGYGVIALGLFLTQAFFKRGFFSHPLPADEWPLVCVEVLLVLIAVLVGILSFLRRGRPTTQTAQQALNRGINNAGSPLNILRTIWPLSRIFPPRPPRVNPVGNPDPGAP